MASVRKREWTSPAGEKKTAWVVAYTDQSGKRRLKTFPLKKVADAERLRIEVEIEKGQHIHPSASATVKEVAEMFIRTYEEKHAAGKVGRGYAERIKSVIDRHILPRLGNISFSDLSFEDLEKWWRDLTRKLARATAREVLDKLRLMERLAQRRQVARTNVVGDFLRDVGGAPKATIKTLNIDDVKRLLALVSGREKLAVYRGHLAFKAMVFVAAFCGLRHGETMGLTLDNVDLKAGVLKVRHSLTAYDELKAPKTKAGVRDVPMPPVVAEHLAEWIERYYVPNERRLVFRMKDDRPITRGNFHLNYWGPLLARAGLPHKGPDRIHFHALRHFAASMMIESGLSLLDTASLLGHASFDMTLQVYAHPIVGGNRRQEAMTRIASTMLTTV